MIKKLLLIFSLINIFCLNSYSDQPKKYWVYFHDKGINSNIFFNKGSIEYSIAISQLTERAIKRRLKVLPPDKIVNYDDLPINESYIESIQKIGGVLQQKIKWLNVATFYLDEKQLSLVKNLKFVKSVEPVKQLIGKLPETYLQKYGDISSLDSSDYGLSYSQYSVVKIPEVHNLGITGDSVIVGMLDTGFRWRSHESLKNTKVLAEWDFINNDDTTANQSNDPAGQDFHGTLTMSILCSYYPKKIIGPAYNSYFLLAKTEYVPTETRIEEDWWAAGIEWLENQGADVVSSSLGYNIFDDGSGYRWEDGSFDGKTAVTTRAAVRAARLGVVVVTAMGNEGNGNGVRGTLLCPADADSIISVGAVTIQGTLAYFSSTGPTNDGRTKPDVVAPGVSIYSAVTPGPSSYGYSQGTSASTPITAGVVALILSARPDLTPIQVRSILRNSSDRIEVVRFPEKPNNFVGWGRINALKALFYPSVHKAGNSSYISTFLGSTYGIFTESVKLVYTVNNYSFDTLAMERYYGNLSNSNGAYRAAINGIQSGTIVRFFISAFDSNNQYIRIPEDSIKLFAFVDGINEVVLDSVVKPGLPEKFSLSYNYPNPFPTPFNSGTTVILDSPISTSGSIVIYNLLGQRIRTLFSGIINIGNNYFYWDTKNDAGIEMGSGIYFLKVQAGNYYSADLKMLLLR